MKKFRIKERKSRFSSRFLMKKIKEKNSCFISSRFLLYGKTLSKRFKIKERKCNFKNSSHLLYVKTIEGNIHISWMNKDCRIIAFEYIYSSILKGRMIDFESIEEYISYIKNVYWINKPAKRRKVAGAIYAKGYPFI